ncbi:MAG TPA: ATP-binding protein [Acetobacteraceae bacterium]|jgi:two-component system nitrogen regulation sensor histidine kinase GlnL|nr:ATP-binding protein [Acetobacteraceae bacterium]
MLRTVLRRREKPALVDPALVLGALPVAIVALDAADRFLFANAAAEQFFLASAAQLSELTLADFVGPDDALFRLLEQVRTEGVSIAGHDLILESPRLSRRSVGVHLAPLPEVKGAVVLKLQDGPVARAFDQGMGFSPAARGVAGMAAVLAHEVKNPLSGIRGAAQLLEATLEPADRELAVLIRDEADRIRALVEQMEAFGEQPPEQRGAVNIHRVLEHVRRLAMSGFARNIRFVEAYDPSLPPVLGSRDQLVQVILNLVKNAAEAINESGAGSGEIALSTGFQAGVYRAAPGGGGGSGPEERRHIPLVVVVRDNGPGIAEGLKPHLFEPFVSGRRAGTGLGLALAAKIVDEHGGLIDVESRPGRTEFRLRLPMATGGEAAGGETQ